MTIDELAEKCEVSAFSVEGWESGKICVLDLKIQSGRKIAAALGLTLNDLFG
jgi:hypothetical protein